MVEETQPPLVAVIEDDGPARIAMGRLLRAAGFDSLLFESAEAFIAAPLPRPPVCLILDVQLGGMSGIDLQQRLHGIGDAPPIIVTTGRREEAIRARAQRAGCAAFFWKPVIAETLLKTIESIAHGSDGCTKVQ
jgi:FixJ family two-component response regulator